MSYDLIKEEVPRFLKRVGDRVIEGSNNVTMVFGTDRAAPAEAKVDSGYGHINSSTYGKSAGSWHVICGRSSVNPNFLADLSFIYLSMNTDVDKNLSLENIEFNTNNNPSAILKSTCVRIVSRKNIKIYSNGSYLTLDGDLKKAVLHSKEIKFGTAANHPLVLGDNFMKTFNDLVNRFNALVLAYNSHVHQTGPSPMAPTSIPAPAPGVQLANFMPQSDLSKVSKSE